MAEASSSGEESSEEEKHDEASPSLRGPVSPITAASPPHSNKKKLRYVRDYLQRLPKHQRRRIQKEIDKGYKPALTVNNITNTLNGIGWGIIGELILGLPRSKCDEIQRQFSSGEERISAGVREWLLRDPLASWRRLIDQLYLQYGQSECHTLADSILHYAEEPTDTTLTHSNLSTVLNHVVDMNKLMDCLNIPYSVKEKIREHNKDKAQQRDECVYYWRNVSPYSMMGWDFLGGRLHYLEQEAALRAAKEYIQRAPELSLVLDNLYTVMESVSQEGLDDEDNMSVVDWLHITVSKQRELRQQYPVVAQRKRAYSAYYLAHHPGPSWRIIATALWRSKEHGALKVVQKLYLKGTSESRRLFEQSMKHGHIDLYTDKMMFYGSAGVGKTCTMSVVAGENPPKIRQSTPIATRPVTMYQMQEMKGKWYRYRSHDRSRLCARISKTTLGQELIETLAKSSEVGTKNYSILGSGSEHRVVASHKQVEANDSEQGMVIIHKQSLLEATEKCLITAEQVCDSSSEQMMSATLDHQQPTLMKLKSKVEKATRRVSELKQNGTTSSRRSVDHDVLKVIHNVLDEMFQLIDECPETEEPLSYIHKVLISDCGGQPQFHEVLPIFLRKMSMIVFVFKLSEDLSTRPMIEYYEKGKALGTPYESDLTTEQLIQQGLQSLHTHRSNKDKDDDIPRIVMIGTHKDKVRRFWEPKHLIQDSINAKDQKLRDMLLPTFKKEVVYYQERTNGVLFPMNAKSPGREEKASAEKIRSAILRNHPSHPRKLPLQWLGLEIILEEITQQLNRGILSMNECLEVARRLHLDESALEAALIYLDELSLVFYYPYILPEVVFTNPQVLLDKISELVKVHHDIKKCSPDHAESEAWQEFFNHALITMEFLSQEIFEEHYVPGLFQPENLLKLFRSLLIFADHSGGKYFVPCLLRMLAEKELAMKRFSVNPLIAPLVLHFPDGPPRRGIFCALISFLTSPENHFPGPWRLKMPARSITPDCLHRNCIQFTIPEADTPCSVMVIDTLLQFEVHVNVSEQPEAEFCSSIKRAISAGLQKANLTLGYTSSTPSFAFLCPCGVGEPHPAKIGIKSWICTLNEMVGKKFSPNHLMWLNSESKTESGSQVREVKGDNGHTTAVSTASLKQGSGMQASSSSGDGDEPIRSKGHSSSAAGTSTAPAELTLKDVAAQAGIKNLDTLDQECCQEVLLSLAKHCVDWQLTGFHLKLTDSDITAVDGDNRTVDEKRIGMLRRWKEQFAFKATYLILLKALLACGRTSDAVNACKAIVSGIGEEQVVFSSSVSEEDFFKWLRSMGVSDKDCKTLSENGVTALEFVQSDAEDFDDIGLTKFGKKRVLKILAEVKTVQSSRSS